VQAWCRFTGNAGSVGARIRILLAIASFAIYASAVLALHQHRNMAFLGEREAFAAALSTTVYGAPLGTIYSGVSARISAYTGVSARVRDPNTPLETLLKQTTEGDVAPGSLLQDGGMDGNGIGYILLATWAMFLFGPHTASPILAMLALMAISGAALLWRFGDDHAVVVVFYFLGLTLLLFTPVVWQPRIAPEILIGGIRYFCIVGTLSAFHLAGELFDTAAPEPAIGWWRFCLLAAQVVILVLAVLTRTSNAALLEVIGLIGLYSLWSHRRDRSHLWRQLGNGAFIAGVAGGFFALIMALLPPKYFGEGRVTGIVWHRAFISLGLNPAWPFGNLREIYDCDYDGFPEGGLEPGLLDKNGECVWLHYAHAHNLSPRLSNIYETVLHETVLREAYFKVARLYPRQVLETYLYYKSLMLYAEIEQAIYPKFDLTNYSLLLRGLFVAAFGILLALLVIPSAAPTPIGSLRFVGTALIFGLSAFPGYYIGWPGTSQTFDLKLYTLLLVGAVLNTFAEWVKRILTLRRDRVGRVS
jgi:hypothetical protein